MLDQRTMTFMDPANVSNRKGVTQGRNKLHGELGKGTAVALI